MGLVKGLLRNQVAAGSLVVPFPVDHSPLPELRLVGADEPVEKHRLVVHRIASPLSPYDGAERYQDGLREARTTLGARGRWAGGVYGAHLFEEVARFAALAGGIAAREPHHVMDTHDWITFAAGIAARSVSGRPLVAHIRASEFDRAGEAANPDICHRATCTSISALTIHSTTPSWPS